MNLVAERQPIQKGERELVDCAYHVDYDGRLLWCSRDCHPHMRECVGKPLESAFPGITETLRDLWEEAWVMDFCARAIFYRGTISYAVAQRNGDRLEVGFQRLPISGLREALEAAEEWIREGHPSIQ